jgi:hypothetical protein
MRGARTRGVPACIGVVVPSDVSLSLYVELGKYFDGLHIRMRPVLYSFS